MELVLRIYEELYKSSHHLITMLTVVLGFCHQSGNVLVRRNYTPKLEMYDASARAKSCIYWPYQRHSGRNKGVSKMNTTVKLYLLRLCPCRLRLGAWVCATTHIISTAKQ